MTQASPRADAPADPPVAAVPDPAPSARPTPAFGLFHAVATTALAALALALSSGPALGAPVKLTATLTGAGESPAADPDGVGGFTATVDPETNDFCYSLWGDKIGKPTMAHVHKGAAGTSGPPVITLTVTGKGDDLCIAVDKDKLQPIVDAPGDYYVNIHNADFPGGAIRGQLTK